MSVSMPNTEPKKEKEMEETGFCQKYQEEVPLSEGCRHPKDYCPYRQACFLYFLSKEKGRENPSH